MKKLRNQMPMPERMKAAARIKKRNQWLAPLVRQVARTHFSTESGIIHCDKLHKFPVRYDQDGAWAAFLDTLPRKPYRMLEMLAKAERKREIAAKVTAKKAAGRVRYMRRFKQQPLTPAEKP